MPSSGTQGSTMGSRRVRGNLVLSDSNFDMIVKVKTTLSQRDTCVLYDALASLLEKVATCLRTCCTFQDPQFHGFLV